MRLYLCLITLLFLSACNTTGIATYVPTSERLEQVRLARAPLIEAELKTADMSLGMPVFLRVFKQEAVVEVWVGDPETETFAPFKSYPICKYSGELGPKSFEGDYQSPEGFYEIRAQQLNPNSQYHLSFDIGFPNAYDAAHGRTGSLLMIHGGCKSVGCFAITDGGIEEVYLMVEASIARGHRVPVHIYPFRMNEMNIYTHFDSRWITFWRNLQEGYDIFEDTNMLPKIAYETGQDQHKYVFEEPDLVAAFIKRNIPYDPTLFTP